jgi:hypothetical protein
VKRRHRHPISDDEQIARYAHLLGNVPTRVADKAYAAAFTRLSEAQRREIVSELRPHLPTVPPEDASEDAEAFAVLMRDLHARIAIVGLRQAGALAGEFNASPPIIAYFTTGAGSVSIDQQPPWVHELAGHVTAPIDAARPDHQR